VKRENWLCRGLCADGEAVTLICGGERNWRGEAGGA
jgi:hypothetical protein